MTDQLASREPVRDLLGDNVDPLRRAKARRNVFNGMISVLREAGLLTREIHDVGELLDVATGRGAFVRAFGSTPAWPSLELALRDDALPTWFEAYPAVDVPWFRAWLSRAAPAIAAGSAVDVVLFGPERDCAPQPDTLGILAAVGMVDPLDEWAFGEMPPMPALESKAQFRARMDAAWDRRADALGSGPKKRAIEQHATWAAQCVAGVTVDEILAPNPRGGDRSTVSKAVSAFGPFVELRAIQFRA